MWSKALAGGRSLQTVQNNKLPINVCGLQNRLNHICDELQLLFWLLCRGSTVSCMTSVLQAGWLQLPHANRWMSTLAMAAWETPRVQTHTLRTLRVDFVSASTSYIYIGQAGQGSVLQNRLKYDLLQHGSRIKHILSDAQNQSKAFWSLKLRFMPAWDVKQLLDAVSLEENGEQKPKLCRVIERFLQHICEVWCQQKPKHTRGVGGTYGITSLREQNI